MISLQEMDRYSAPWWREVLLRCGVKMMTAEVWSTAFAEHVKPEHFSLGEREMDDLLGQCLVETSMLEHLEEDLMYSAKRMVQVWPSRFVGVNAHLYENNPRALANKVYGGRMGNTGPDDGWTYRGRGCPMITGRDNYALVARETGLDVLSRPELLATPDGALRGLVAWWEKRVPDSAIDDPERVTKAVQGGAEALDRRRQLTERAAAALKE